MTNITPEPAAENNESEPTPRPATSRPTPAEATGETWRDTNPGASQYPGGFDDAPRTPYGGNTPPPAAPQGGWVGGSGTGSDTNQLAVVSLIASIASFIFLPFIGAVAGIVTGFMARKQIRETGQGGDKLALWGIIVGFVHIALAVLGTLLFILLFVVAAAAGSHSIQQQGDQTQQCIDQYQSNPNCSPLTSP